MRAFVTGATGAIGTVDMRHFDRDFALTNRLRTEGTDHLLWAGEAAGVRLAWRPAHRSWRQGFAAP